MCATGIVAVLLMAAPGPGRAGGEWPDGPNKQWFQNLERPDNNKHPYRDPRSRWCCGAGDVVKTKFKVEGAGDKHPDDQWYAWITEQWIPIPPDKSCRITRPMGNPICSWRRARCCAS
jgi:hypothetical protein